MRARVIFSSNTVVFRDPIVVGVQVTGGVLRTGTPMCVPSKDFIYIGVCTGIQHNNKDVDIAKKGDEVRTVLNSPHPPHLLHLPHPPHLPLPGDGRVLHEAEHEERQGPRL